MASNYICLSCFSGHGSKSDLMDHMASGRCEMFGNRIVGVSRRGNQLHVTYLPWLKRRGGGTMEGRVMGFGEHPGLAGEAGRTKLTIDGPLHQECLNQVNHYRSYRPKGAVAEGYVGLLLKSRSGQLDREPDFNGQKPDYEWTVAPETPTSYRFIIEVVYGEDTSKTVDLVKTKVDKYRPLEEHQLYVVALVYEESVDLKEVTKHCMGKLKVTIGINRQTGESTTETEVIPQKYTSGYASLLWLIPFPTDVVEGRMTSNMQVCEILSGNAKRVSREIFGLNLSSSPGISRT